MRRIVTGTKIATRNLQTRIGQAAHLHPVQLLVILVGRRVIDFTDAALHIVLEAHSRKRGVLRFAQHRFAARHQHLVFLVEQDCIGIQRSRPVLQLGLVVQVERRSLDIVYQVDRMIFNRIRSRGIVHPVDFGRVFFHLFPLFEFKAGHLLAMSGRSDEGRQQKQQNGPQKPMGSRQNHVGR